MMAMSQICRALGLYAEDHDGVYPIPSEPPVPFENLYSDFPAYIFPKAWPVGKNRRVTWLQTFLSPKYIKDLPLNDSWGNPILCEVTRDGRNCTIMSLGKDDLPNDHFPGYYWNVNDVDNDIISVGFSDRGPLCRFISAPEGFTH